MKTRNFQLYLMRAWREETRARLATLLQRLKSDAESATRSNGDLPPTFGRHASNWTRRHEQDFQRRLSDLRLRARNEIGSIESKLARQSAAITAMHLSVARRAEK